MTDPRELTAENFAPPSDLARIRRTALGLGIAGAALCVLGLVVDREQVFRSHLVAWIFWMGIAMGGFGTMLLHHMTRGAWGLLIRRIFEAGARTLPVLVLLFLPVLFGLTALFPWARPEAAADSLIQTKAWYLNPGFFMLRAAIYFAIWGLFTWVLLRRSRLQDETRNPGLLRKMQNVAGPGLGIYGLTATFGSVDWLMSLDPHWYSSLFGVYFIGGQAVAAMAAAILMVRYLAKRPPLEGVFQPRHYHDYGNLLMAFMLLWSYFGLSQLLIIWTGNLPEETVWYIHRSEHGWQWVSIALALFHFAVPFFLLLNRSVKRDIDRLAKVAVLLLVVHWLDVYWLAAPAWHEHLTVHWLDLAATVAVGGLWFGAFCHALGKRPLLPLGDPYLDEALES